MTEETLEQDHPLQKLDDLVLDETGSANWETRVIILLIFITVMAIMSLFKKKGD